LGDQIQIRRYEKGLLQSQLAKIVGITISVVRAWERGEQLPNDRELQLLKNHLAWGNESTLPKPNP
jgi:DNA-binding transcriptional regulator YiaG